MEVIVFLFFIVLVALIVNLKNGIVKRLVNLEKEITKLREQLRNAETPVSRPKEEKPTPLIIPKPKVPPVTPDPLPEKSTPLIVPKQDQHIPGAPVEEPKITPETSSTPVPVNLPQTQKPSKPVKPKQPGFFERHPDLEKFIGENLISKIGIGILVLGIVFFVKYAIDNEWIGPVGRVAVGLLCGGILIGIAHYLRNSYTAFSSVLIGGGIAVFYFTISFAFHQYHLFGETTAFIIMLVITAFAVMLSLLYNRQELAIIALAGGFLTPFIVSTGSGNFKTLFIYLIILNIGLLIIALQKAWRLLNLLAFIFTVILFGAWLIKEANYEKPAMFRDGFVFATIFYVLFFTINIIHNIKEKKKFIASDFGILLSNTCLYFAAGLYCLNLMDAGNYYGIFCIVLSIFNLIISYFLFRKDKVDTNILYLLIGITLTFISLTAPIQLNGNYITIFWASEAVLLYWLYQKSSIKLIRVASLIVWICMILSLIIDINDMYYPYGDTKLAIVFNKAFITTLFSAFASFLLFILRKKDPVPVKKGLFGLTLHANIFCIAAMIILYYAGYFEIHYQFIKAYPTLSIHELYLACYTLTYLLIIILLVKRFNALQLNNRTTTIILLIGAFLIYINQIGNSFFVQRELMEKHLSAHFTIHWLTTIVTGILLYQLIKFFRSILNSKIEWISWLICTGVVLFLTTEIHLIINSLFYSVPGSLITIQKVFVKAGWPILWGLLSFCFMWLGMKYKFRILRIISLTLFTITLIKLFAYDIVNIPAGGKIAAFFSLGVLLLVVSFMYQRLKKIIIDEEVGNK